MEHLQTKFDIRKSHSILCACSCKMRKDGKQSIFLNDGQALTWLDPQHLSWWEYQTSLPILRFIVYVSTQPPQRPWWCNQMDTFSASLTLCNPLVNWGFSSHRPVKRSFYVFFDLCLNKRLGTQSRPPWLETPSRSLWRYSNDRLCRRKLDKDNTIKTTFINTRMWKHASQLKCTRLPF